MSRVDADHNAGAPLDPRVREAMLPALGAANPSSTHADGRRARELLDGARRKVARLLGVEPGEVVFTASGSEADALALAGSFHARRKVSARVLVSAIEHPAIRETATQLAKQGAEVVELPVDANGVLRLDALEAELSKGAALVAVMLANNETGVVQPASDVERLASAAGVPFVCDAVQAAGKLALPTIPSLLTLSAHKFGGPQGSGALIVRRGVELAPLVGGHQERGRRGGTENVASAVGFAAALELAIAEHAATATHTANLRNLLEDELVQALPGLRINGAGAKRLPNTSSISFPGVDGEALLIALDLAGVNASLGAACASGALSPSHVLLAMGLSAREARSALRFSFGRANTEGEIRRLVALVVEHASRAKSAR